jgi:hypothetical protein
MESINLSQQFQHYAPLKAETAPAPGWLDPWLLAMLMRRERACDFTQQKAMLANNGRQRTTYRSPQDNERRLGQ